MAENRGRPSETTLGIDIGGTGIKGALVDTKSGTLATPRLRLATPKPATPKTVAETVAEFVEHFEWEARFGCTVPARVRNGVLETASNIDKSWIGTDASEILERASGQPAVIINDADAAGIAEVRFGAGKDQRGVTLVLTFGTGIGSALFVDGRLVPNTELGHLELVGQILEDRASNAARKKEDLTWEQWAKRVQAVLDHVEFIFGPDLIVIGGGVSRPKRWEKYRRFLDTRARLAPALLENEAGIIGAACIAAPD